MSDHQRTNAADLLTVPAPPTDSARIQVLERQVFLLIAIVERELGKEAKACWNHQLRELYELRELSGGSINRLRP